MSSEVKLWLSATELSLLGERSIAALPTTLQGCKWRAKKEGWISREVKGSGGPGGMRTEYQPPFEVFVQVKTFLDMNPDFLKKKRARVEPVLDRHQVRQDAAPYADDGFVLIDKYVDVLGSAGPGAHVNGEAIVQVQVDAGLLRERIGNGFSSLKIVGVSGDSMEPTLSHGDQVLVDTSCNRFINNAIYVIQQDGHLRFKRIYLKLDGSIEVHSDALPVVEAYTAEVAAGFYVIGKVIPFKFGRFKV